MVPARFMCGSGGRQGGGRRCRSGENRPECGAIQGVSVAAPAAAVQRRGFIIGVAGLSIGVALVALMTCAILR